MPGKYLEAAVLLPWLRMPMGFPFKCGGYDFIWHYARVNQTYKMRTRAPHAGQLTVSPTPVQQTHEMRLKHSLRQCVALLTKAGSEMNSNVTPR